MGYITLKQYLERSGATQAEIAEQLGISPASISQYLSGKQLPSLDLALRMEQLFGVPCRSWAAPPVQLRERRKAIVRRRGARRVEDRAAGDPDRRAEVRR